MNFKPITVGFEWEANTHQTRIKELAEKVLPYYYTYDEGGRVYREDSVTGWGAYWENSTIYELQTPIFSLSNPIGILNLFQTFLKYGAANKQSGRYDPLAGSMHTHIGFEGEMPEKVEDFQEIFSFIKERGWLDKNENIEHRTSEYIEGEYDFYDDIAIDCKDYPYELNTLNLGKPQTLEIRDNENPTPIWVFFLPVFWRYGTNITTVELIEKTLVYYEGIRKPKLFVLVLQQYVDLSLSKFQEWFMELNIKDY